MLYIRARYKTQEIVSAWTHGLALALSVVGLIVLVVLAVETATPWHIVSFSIYGASLIVLYAASMLYHVMNAIKGFNPFYQKLDQAMIFLLIAGTYTPLCLVSLRGEWGWSMFGIIWGLALFGIITKLVFAQFNRWIINLYYLLMGWLVVISYAPLMRALPLPAFVLIFVGGFFYTAGVLLMGLERKIRISRYIGMHEVFHIFVMFGSASHFLVMYWYVL